MVVVNVALIGRTVSLTISHKYNLATIYDQPTPIVYIIGIIINLYELHASWVIQLVSDAVGVSLPVRRI